MCLEVSFYTKQFIKLSAILAQRPQGVDILFEESSSIEEMPSTSTVSQTVPQISHKDGERYFTPVDNKPMKAPGFLFKRFYSN